MPWAFKQHLCNAALPHPPPPLPRTNAKLRYCHVQCRPQSLRYHCPAERENEDLWEDPFELGISLAINRACTVPPKVDKQAKNNNFVTRFPIFYAARDGCASEHGAQAPGKSLLGHINQHHVRGCCNFNALSNPNDLFGAKSESENPSRIILKITGLELVKMTIYHNLSAIFRDHWRTLCQKSRTEQGNPASQREEGEEKSFCRKRTRIKASNKKECNGDPQRAVKFKIMKSMPLESHAISKVLYNSSRINSGTCVRWIKPWNVISGLCNCEFCKIASWHNVSDFLTLYLCRDLSLGQGSYFQN